MQSAIPSNLPSSASEAPWVRALANPGSPLKPLTSLPNLNLLEHPATSVAGSIHPGYVAQPAPLGLADYGLGATTYSYNTSHLLGQVTFNAPPNVTDPGSSGVVVPTASHLGDVGSVYEFGIQLNTVATNISIPGLADGFFWTQNVVNWNDTGIHFVDDTFNLSSPRFFIPAGTIYSGCNNSTAGVDEILTVYGGVFQCVGGTIPVSPASYPVTVQLFNNATVNVENRVQVTYGYRIDEAGLGKVYAGVSDTIVFNSPGAPSTPPVNAPGFSIDGFAPAPAGLLRDAEIVLVGDIGGDNAVFRSLNGTINLEYSNASLGGWQNVPSAYNFGGDTGETSTGIADFWTPSHSLVINQGPSMLYGLWNAVPSVSVASGDIQLSGSISPAYGFVFVSNTPPVADPWAPNASADNMSWLPTTNAGTFNTYLPPLGAPWTTQYYVQGFAAGSAEANGTPITGSDTHYVLDLPSALGVLDAPLYMFSNAQAGGLALNVTGSSTAPFAFHDLTVNINTTFNHLNDYGYPSFELLLAQGVTQPVYVDNITQGQDSPSGNYYILDGPASGLISPAPAVTSSLPGLTSQINLYNGLDDLVTNETLSAPTGQGGEVVLWEDRAARVSDVAVEDGSQGIWIGESHDTTVDDLSVNDGVGIQDIGSTNTSGSSLSVVSTIGVLIYGSSGDRFSWVNYSGPADGIEAGYDSGPLLGQGPGFGYYDVPGSQGLTVDNLSVSFGYFGAALDFSNRSTFDDVSMSNGIGAIALVETVSTAIDTLVTNATSYAAFLYDANWTNLTHVRASGDLAGVVTEGDTHHAVVTRSEFLACSSWGVAIVSGTDNFVYDNDFLANNGSSFTYSPAHIQAYSAPGNYFNSSAGVGNYWADWHSFAGGRLNPYPISHGVSDYFPVALGPGMYLVTFVESTPYLPPSASWSVGFVGLRQSTTGTSISFPAINGSYPYVITGPPGRGVSSPAPEGTITVTGADVGQPVSFARATTYALNFHEGGLVSGTPWCVTIGAPICSTTPTLTLRAVSPGTYSYQIQQIPGLTTLVKVGGTWLAETHGSYTVGVTHDLPAHDTVQVRFGYPVTFTETGLSGAFTWSVSSGGETGTSSNATIVLSLMNGTSRFSVHPVAGYRAIPSSGRVMVSGSPSYQSIVFTPRGGHVPARGSPATEPILQDARRTIASYRAG